MINIEKFAAKAKMVLVQMPVVAIINSISFRQKHAVCPQGNGKKIKPINMIFIKNNLTNAKFF